MEDVPNCRCKIEMEASGTWNEVEAIHPVERSLWDHRLNCPFSIDSGFSWASWWLLWLLWVGIDRFWSIPKLTKCQICETQFLLSKNITWLEQLQKRLNSFGIWLIWWFRVVRRSFGRFLKCTALPGRPGTDWEVSRVLVEIGRVDLNFASTGWFETPQATEFIGTDSNQQFGWRKKRKLSVWSKKSRETR